MNTANTGYTVDPYLFLNGRCEEAIEFYRKALGAQVQMLMRIKDAPPGAMTRDMPPGWEDKILHATISIGGHSTIMMADGCPDQRTIEGFALSAQVSTPPEAEKVFKALAEGGQVQMPLTKTFFSPAFGMLKDKFGVAWMVYVTQQP